MKNETFKDKKKRCLKLSVAQKAKNKKVRAAELVRARKIVVPWERRRWRRIEMHAASKDYSLAHKNAKVLYMISEDGKTIRRVTMAGAMGTSLIVGPVKDPEEAGPSVSEEEAGPSEAGPSKIEVDRPPVGAYDSDLD